MSRVRLVTAALLSGTLATGCQQQESVWPPEERCVDGRACTNILCSPQSRVEELLDAVDVLRREKQHPPDVSARLMACTEASLAGPDVPGRGYMCEPPPSDPAERFSPMDIAQMVRGRLEDYGLLSSSCPSRREVLLVTAELWAREPGGPELLARASTDPRPGSARLGRRGLILAGNADAIGAAARDLQSADRRTVLVALSDLASAGAAAREYVPAIISAADTDARLRDDVLPYVLGTIGGERAIERLVTDARSPHVDIRDVIRSLAAAGRDAAPAGPALRELAMTHYLGDVRSGAARAYEDVTGEHIEPARVPCPKSVTESAVGWTAELSSATLRFAAVGWPEDDEPWPDYEEAERSRLLAAGACAASMIKRRAYVGLEARGSCLIGINHGEFGGGVLAIDGSGNIQRLFRGNPERFVDEGPRGILAFEGIAHLRLDRGSVRRLVRQTDGSWQVETVAALEVNPVGFARDAEGRLILLARNSEQLGGRAPLACRYDPSFIVVRIEDDGHVAVMN